MVFEVLAGVALLSIVAAMLFTAALVYRDARRSGTRYPPLLWGALTAVGGAGGVVLYVLVEKLHLLGRPEAERPS